jgi:hypothetical protein
MAKNVGSGNGSVISGGENNGENLAYENGVVWWHQRLMA